MRRLSMFWPLQACRRAGAGRLLVAAAVVVLVAVAASMPTAVAREGDRLVFRPPVDAPVDDPFRSPDDPYGPGNRGIEYDTEPGDVVRAAAAGIVVFAGPVAGELHVTVDHGGGVVSSYSYLERISVRVDSGVSQGQVIGLAGDRLHFGVRVDGSYVDPGRFIGVRQGQGAARAAGTAPAPLIGRPPSLPRLPALRPPTHR